MITKAMRRARIRGDLQRALGVVVVGLALLVSGCDNNNHNAAATPEDFSVRGPYAVGVTQLQLETGAPVEVFYPVDIGALPTDATAYAYTPDQVWGALVSLFPPGVVSTRSAECLGGRPCQLVWPVSPGGVQLRLGQ